MCAWAEVQQQIRILHASESQSLRYQLYSGTPSTKGTTKDSHVCRVGLGNEIQTHRFKSDVSGTRALDTYIPSLSAIYETTKLL